MPSGSSSATRCSGSTPRARSPCARAVDERAQLGVGAAPRGRDQRAVSSPRPSAMRLDRRRRRRRLSTAHSRSGARRAGAGRDARPTRRSTIPWNLCRPSRVGRPQRVEAGEPGEVAERPLRRAPPWASRPPRSGDALRGIDPEALGRLLVTEQRALAGRHRGEEEARGEADRARRRRDEVREVAEAEPRSRYQPSAARSAANGAASARRSRRMRSTRAATAAPRPSTAPPSPSETSEQHAGLLEQLARGGDPEGERRDPVERRARPGGGLGRQARGSAPAPRRSRRPGPPCRRGTRSSRR